MLLPVVVPPKFTVLLWGVALAAVTEPMVTMAGTAPRLVGEIVACPLKLLVNIIWLIVAVAVPPVTLAPGINVALVAIPSPRVLNGCVTLAPGVARSRVI